MQALKEIDFKALMQSEHTRKIAIGFGIGLFALAITIYFAVFPTRATIKNMDTKISETRNQLKTDQQLIENKEVIHENHRAAACQLLDIMTETLAPNQNAVSWVGTLFQNIASQEGLKMTDITGETINSTLQDKTQIPLFENFKAKATMRGRYHNFGRFIAELERRIPIAKLSLISINQPRTSETETPPLSIKLEFSFPRFTEEGFPLEKRPVKDDCRPTSKTIQDNGSPATNSDENSNT